MGYIVSRDRSILVTVSREKKIYREAWGKNTVYRFTTLFSRFKDLPLKYPLPPSRPSYKYNMWIYKTCQRSLVFSNWGRGCSVTNCNVKQAGALLPRCAATHTLKCTDLSGTVVFWWTKVTKVFKTGVIWSIFLVPLIMRTAKLCTCCRRDTLPALRTEVVDQTAEQYSL
jgi:hypothetical protein